MAETQKTTVYLDAGIYRALKVKAAITERGLSALVNEALALSFTEDAIDSVAVRKRARERSRPFAAALRDLKRDGLIG
jgi:hypothetical protein